VIGSSSDLCPAHTTQQRCWFAATVVSVDICDCFTYLLFHINEVWVTFLFISSASFGCWQVTCIRFFIFSYVQDTYQGQQKSPLSFNLSLKCQEFWRLEWLQICELNTLVLVISKGRLPQPQPRRCRPASFQHQKQTQSSIFLWMQMFLIVFLPTAFGLLVQSENNLFHRKSTFLLVKKGKVFPYSLPSVGPELIPVYRQSACRWL